MMTTTAQVIQWIMNDQAILDGKAKGKAKGDKNAAAFRIDQNMRFLVGRMSDDREAEDFINRASFAANIADELDRGQVLSVYSGAYGKCCCGCSGNYRYASEFRELAGQRRGYAISDDEVSDRSVTIVKNKIIKAAMDGHDVTVDRTFSPRISAVVGDRLYIASLKS